MELKELLYYFISQKKNFIRLLKKLVSFRTYSRESDNINFFLDYLEKLFSEFDPRMTRKKTKRGDILSFSFYPKNKNFLVLLSHADTVKVSESTISAKVIGNRLYGNGCYDMKSAIGVIYFVVKALQHFKLKPDKQIRVIFTPDEEISSEISMPFLLNKCRGASAVILAEPCCSDGGVKTTRKGIAFVTARLKGRAAHSGIEPEKGVDANRALTRLVVMIDDILKNHKDISFNPGIISGGVQINVVSPVSILQGELRSYSNAMLKRVIKKIEKINRIGKAEVDLSIEMKHPALEFDNKNKRLYKIARKIARSINYPLTAGSSGGGSDGSSLSAAGIPVIDGLGLKGGGAHSLHEYIEISDFPYRASLITGLCLEL